jgi:predicted transcriptional regulator
VQFGFMRADPAGHVAKRFALPRLPLPRYGAACPLWAVYAAFRSPGTTVRQLAEFPGGGRCLMLARAIEKERGGYGTPRRFMSVMLMCESLHADRLIYADGLDMSPGAPATPVGTACRVCVRTGCSSRQEEPILPARAPDTRPGDA